MKHLVIIILISLTSCSEQEQVDFNYQVESDYSAIVIDNYKTTSEKSLTTFLKKIQEKEKFDSMNVFLTGDNVYAINPRYMEFYFSKKENYKRLNYNSYDSLKLLKNTRIWIGAFKDGNFKADKFTDSVSLDKRLFMVE